MKSIPAAESQTFWPLLLFSCNENHSNRIREIRDAIASRAYELYEERGHRHGHDLEDWLSAESETLLPIALKTYDFEDKIIIRAEIPMLTADDIEVSVESHRIMISDKDRLDVDGCDDSRPNKRLFHTLVLPDYVDSASAATAFKDGVLEIEVLKVPSVDSLATLD